MKELPADQGLKIFDIKWKANTAGPSPDNNERVELFLLGCKKAAQGNQCEGCFNFPLWNDSIAEFSWDPIDVANRINELAPNKYITIGGGEPTDQIDHLVPLCKALKEYGFHIMMYTWKDVNYAFGNYALYYSKDNDFYIDKHKVNELFQYLDMVVDGPFDVNEVLYDISVGDGFLNSIGSGNQRIWDLNTKQYKYMRDLKGLTLDKDNNLIYKPKN